LIIQIQRFIYDLIIRLYGLGIRCYAPFNAKAALWVRGRKNWQKLLSEKVGHGHDTCIWIHAASLGEFEQGRPIIEAIRTEFPKKKLVLTFFSPSGYEVRKEYNQVDVVSYLPLDTKSNAKKFLDILNPEIAIFIKYEFWFNYLNTLKDREIRTILVSGRMHENQGFFKPWGGLFRAGLKSFERFFLQDKRGEELLLGIGVENVTVCGDSRFDRVMKVRQENEELKEIKEFVGDKKALVVGSSWQVEEEMVQRFIVDHLNMDIKIIIAPHEIHSDRIESFSNECRWPCAKLSTWKGQEAKVLFIDSIGKLATVYRYGSIAFVGGGFGSGIHSVLEPAVWGLPVLFGPNYKRFQEAKGLVAADAAFPIQHQEEMEARLELLLETDEIRAEAGQKAYEYCQGKAGATEVVMKYLRKELDKKRI
jgi:3-deoxy-D-manno-octulosonic-acid transferase